MKNVDVKVKLHKYEKRPDTHAFDFKETKKKALFVENQEFQDEILSSFTATFEDVPNSQVES